MRKPKFINNTKADHSSLIELANHFFPFAQKQMGFSEPVTVVLISDEENAANHLGKTGYYDPSDGNIGLYTDNRHPKDILRSLAHELVHHTQNGNGMFDMDMELGAGYAQNDEHMREMERQAYELGNMCFRDWEDNHKEEIQKWDLKESIRRELKKRLVENLPGASDEAEEAEGPESGEGPTGRPPESVADRPDPRAAGEDESGEPEEGEEEESRWSLRRMGLGGIGSSLKAAWKGGSSKDKVKGDPFAVIPQRGPTGEYVAPERKPFFSADEQTDPGSSWKSIGQLSTKSDPKLWAEWIMSYENPDLIKKAFYTLIYDEILWEIGKTIDFPMDTKMQIAQHYTRMFYGPNGPGYMEAPPPESAAEEVENAEEAEEAEEAGDAESGETELATRRRANETGEIQRGSDGGLVWPAT